MIAFDTNVLAYAAFAAADSRKERAIDLLAQGALADATLPMQALVEFANAALKRRRLPPAIVARRVAEWATIFATVPTHSADVVRALDLVVTAKIAYFDALIVTVARSAGATVLLSEDMQDGALLAGVRIINPFVAANDATVAALLTPAS